MMFQVSDLKESNFLDLVNSNDNILEPIYSKCNTWLQHMLYARAIRVIMNHAPIGEYWLQVFPSKEFSCPYNLYPIELR